MLKQDTPLPENKPRNDQVKTTPAPAGTAEEMSHGQESYPGSRAGGEADKPNQTPQAGDVDPGSTSEADNTGQAGKAGAGQQAEGNPWNG